MTGKEDLCAALKKSDQQTTATLQMFGLPTECPVEPVCDSYSHDSNQMTKIKKMFLIAGQKMYNGSPEIGHFKAQKLVEFGSRQSSCAR